MRCLDSTTYTMDMNLSKLWEMVKNREPWRAAVHGSQRVRHGLVTEQQQSPICSFLLLFFWCWIEKIITKSLIHFEGSFVYGVR